MKHKRPKAKYNIGQVIYNEDEDAYQQILTVSWDADEQCYLYGMVGDIGVEYPEEELRSLSKSEITGKA